MSTERVEAATLVFVDALAAEYFERFPSELRPLEALPERIELEPGMGFSINIKAELLGGLTPDDLGFFCKWNYAPRGGFQVPRWIRALGGALDGTQFTSRLAHRAFSRVLGVDLFTIPFRELELFAPAACPEAYASSFPHPTLLSELGFRRVVHGRRMRRDADVARAALQAMDDGRHTYVSLVEPDAVGHRRGPGSEGMRRALAATAHQVASIWEAHRRHRRGPFILFSDHGMAPVRERAWFDPSEVLGPPGHSTYACFSDSTMLRFWIHDPEIRTAAEEALAALTWGRVLDGEERRRFGIASPAHGDVILLADEGVLPVPSHVGGKHPRAVGMHGYHPDLPSQRGVVAWWHPDGTPSAGELRSAGLPLAGDDRGAPRIRARDFSVLARTLIRGRPA